MRSSGVRLGGFPLVLLAALSLSSWAQEAAQEKPAPPPAKTEATAAKTEAIEAEAVEKETSEAQAPKRFVPSQRTPADNSASFPVDI